VHALFEVAKDVLSRASDPKDKEAVVEAIKTTDKQTIVGPINWKNGPVPNVAKVPLVGGQWRKGDSGAYELVIVSNSIADMIPKADDPRPIEG
jgi:branched-chain amino acid transport system substrate-binding protein